MVSAFPNSVRKDGGSGLLSALVSGLVHSKELTVNAVNKGPKSLGQLFSIYFFIMRIVADHVPGRHITILPLPQPF